MNEIIRVSTSSERERSTKSIEPVESNYGKLLLSTTKKSEGRFNMKFKSSVPAELQTKESGTNNITNT